MYAKMYFEFVRNIIFPYASMRFYLTYLTFWQQIVQHRNPWKRLLIYAIIALSLYIAAKHLYLYLGAPSELTRIVHFDALYLVMMRKNGANLLVVFSALMNAILFRMFYLVGDERNYGKLFGVMFLQNPDFLQLPSFPEGKIKCEKLRQFATRICWVECAIFVGYCEWTQLILATKL